MVKSLYSTNISIPLGIIIGLLASFVQSLGLTIQRKSHVLNQSLPEHQRHVEHRRPLWLLGFAIFISSNVIGSLIQIASLPVVILAPLGAVSLLWNAFFARLILGDVFSPWMILGTILIAGGAVLIAFFGIVPEPTRSLEDLLTLFSRPAFVVYFSILGTVVVVCLVATHITDFALSRRLSQIASPISSPSDSCSTHAMSVPSKPTTAALTTGVTTPLADAGVASERTPLLDRKSTTSSTTSSLYGKVDDADTQYINRTRLLLAISYASFSGILSGMCLLFAKSGVELLLLTFRGHNQFWRWQAWLLVLGLVVFALLQLWYLHKALILADPTLVCPSAFCFYNLSSIVNGLVYFDQFSLIPPFHLGLVVLGMSVLLGGVWVVSIQSGAREVDLEGWSDSDDLEEASVLDEGSQDALGRLPQNEIGPISLGRETRSESNIHDLSRVSGASPRSKRLQRLLSPERRETLPLPLSPTRARGPPRRRRTTLDAWTHPPSSHHTPEASPPLTLGGGFQIGLSPVSPGFSIVPRERGRRVSALADIVEEVTSQEEWQRRRTVSEGDMRRRAGMLESGDHEDRVDDVDDDAGGAGVEGIAASSGKGKGREAKRRWDWLRRVIRR